MRKQLAFAVEMLQEHGRLAMQYFVLKEGKEIATAIFNFKNEEEKDHCLCIGQAMAVYHEADEFVCIAEAWMSPQSPDDILPSESDQRKEVLVLTHGTVDESGVEVYEIVRKEDGVSLAQYEPNKKMEIGGRFSSFMDMVGKRTREEASVTLDMYSVFGDSFARFGDLPDVGNETNGSLN